MVVADMLKVTDAPEQTLVEEAVIVTVMGPVISGCICAEAVNTVKTNPMKMDMYLKIMVQGYFW